jgi:sulfite reductase (NADPH) flavoprotein alpha-component
MSHTGQVYDKTHPFLATISERSPLCHPGSDKNVMHVALNLHGSGIKYLVGDSLAVQPVNDPELVSRTLQALGATGSETVLDKHTKEPWSLAEFLKRKCNLADLSRKLIGELAARQTDPQKKERLASLLKEEQREAFKEYQGAHEVWDALEENREALFSPQELCSILQPLLPRFYSIASSMAAVGEQVHLTVAELRYVTNQQQRWGACTHYLCRLAPLHEPSIPVYLHPSNGFTLPANPEAELIMVGPGTGIAPFRGFMQEREVQRSQGVKLGSSWIFFGERHRTSEFFYEKEWEQWIQNGLLKLDTAFSRDQPHKVYVQHRMLEQGSELFRKLDRGAYFYVCGDAHRMAKDVDAALHQIVQQHGHLSEHAAKEYVKKLKAEKRYLRDVY